MDSEYEAAVKEQEEDEIAEKLTKEISESPTKQREDCAEEIYQIFDKVFKKIITLSTKAVINLINGLFDTDYPLDSAITYNWTEFVDDSLRKILADTILTINGKYSYHLEAQMEKDNSIVFRVFDYGYSHANRTRTVEDGRYILRFPKPMVIYLYYESQVPDEYVLTVEYDGGKDVYEYKVPVLKLPELSAQELSDRKLVILIPFHVLKLRYALKKGNYENLEELQNIIRNDIIGHIEKNTQMGNITMEDALKLKRYLQSLCNYLCSHYEELEAIRDMTDESFMTDIDIICKEYQEAIKERDKQLAEQSNQLVEQSNQLAEQQRRIAELERQLQELKN